MSDPGATPPPYPEGNQPPPPPYPQGGGYPPPPYGQPAYAQPGPAAGNRPGTVLAGCIMAWVGGSIGTFLGLVLLVAGDDVAAKVGAPEGAIAFAGIVLALVSLAAVVLAVFAFRRVKGAAIGLLVLAVLYLGFLVVALAMGERSNLIGGFYSVASAWLVYGSKDSKAWFSGA